MRNGSWYLNVTTSSPLGWNNFERVPHSLLEVPVGWRPRCPEQQPAHQLPSLVHHLLPVRLLGTPPQSPCSLSVCWDPLPNPPASCPSAGTLSPMSYLCLNLLPQGPRDPNPRWADSVLCPVLKAKGSVEAAVQTYRDCVLVSRSSSTGYPHTSATD